MGRSLEARYSTGSSRHSFDNVPETVAVGESLEMGEEMDQTAALFEKWQGWLKNDLLQQFQDLIIDQMIADALRKSLGPFAGQEEGADIVLWIARGHIANICLAIRRLNDKDKQSISLRRLLENLKANAFMLTEDNLVKFRGGELCPSGEETTQANIESDLTFDIDMLKKYGDKVHEFADKYLAHHDKNAHKIELPTWGDIREAVRCYHYLYRKWGLIVAGMSCQLDDPNPLDLLPSDVEDYEEQFKQMWRALRDQPE
jgi:hypothetical protein